MHQQCRQLQKFDTQEGIDLYGIIFERLLAQTVHTGTQCYEHCLLALLNQEVHTARAPQQQAQQHHTKHHYSTLQTFIYQFTYYHPTPTPTLTPLPTSCKLQHTYESSTPEFPTTIYLANILQCQHFEIPSPHASCYEGSEAWKDSCWTYKIIGSGATL